MSPIMGFFGFPPGCSLTGQASETPSENKEEYDFLMGQILPAAS